MVADGYGSPRNYKLTNARIPGEITEDLVQQMFSKSDRVSRESLSTYLPVYFDDTPIGPATYAIRWKTYKQSLKHLDSEHPLHEAWLIEGPNGIKLMEFVMDIRKGEFSKKDIAKNLLHIQNTTAEIKAYQEKGNWFALAVTSGSIREIDKFCKRFNTCQEFVDTILPTKRVIK